MGVGRACGFGRAGRNYGPNNATTQPTLKPAAERAPRWAQRGDAQLRAAGPGSGQCYPVLPVSLPKESLARGLAGSWCCLGSARAQQGIRAGSVPRFRSALSPCAGSVGRGQGSTRSLPRAPGACVRELLACSTRRSTCCPH